MNTLVTSEEKPFIFVIVSIVILPDIESYKLTLPSNVFEAPVSTTTTEFPVIYARFVPIIMLSIPPFTGDNGIGIPVLDKYLSPGCPVGPVVPNVPPVPCGPVGPTGPGHILAKIALLFLFEVAKDELIYIY